MICNLALNVILYCIFSTAYIKLIVYKITFSLISAIFITSSLDHGAFTTLITLYCSFAIFFYNHSMNLFLMIGGWNAHFLSKAGILMKELENAKLQVSFYKQIIEYFFFIYQMNDFVIFSIPQSLDNNFDDLMESEVFLIQFSCFYYLIFDRYIYQYATDSFFSQQHSNLIGGSEMDYLAYTGRSLLGFIFSLFDCYSIFSCNYQL